MQNYAKQPCKLRKIGVLLIRKHVTPMVSFEYKETGHDLNLKRRLFFIPPIPSHSWYTYSEFLDYALMYILCL
jgi:hypothetical protein